jgi:two-component system nitrogen regulation response regulator GlnG
LLTILCHPDIRRIGHSARLFELGQAGEMGIHRFEPVFGDAQGQQLAPLSTRRVSRVPVVVTSQEDGCVRLCTPSSVDLFVDGQKAERELECSPSRLARGIRLRLGKYVLLELSLCDLRRGAAVTSSAYAATRELLGHSPVMQRLREEIARLHDLEISVLLRGETGVGKELVATALQRCSPRRDAPFLRVNIGAIPGSLAVAELFGYAKGAFTSAGNARAGYFSDAHGGTLFLDEIGTSPMELQSALLRVMETGIIQPLGGKQQQVSVRLIAATDADLDAAVEAGKFSHALVRRFGYVIHVPPLRERREDIPELFARFVADGWYTVGEQQRLDVKDLDARPILNALWMEQIMACDWPGNVRQLQAAALRFVIYNRGRATIQLDPELQAQVERTQLETPVPVVKVDGAPNPKAPRGSIARGLTQEQIVAAHEASDFDIERTARALGVSRSFLHAKIDELPDIRKAKDLARDEIQSALDAHGHDLGRAARSLRVSPKALQLQMTRLGIGRRESR